MDQWKEILPWLLEETKGMHRWYSSACGWMFLTDTTGERHRIDHTMNRERIEGVLLYIRLINQ